MGTSLNPLLNLEYEPMMENLGDDYYDLVTAADFPCHFLRYRNDRLLPLLGLKPNLVTDGDFVAAFGQFRGVRPFLALRYHGYQLARIIHFWGMVEALYTDRFVVLMVIYTIWEPKDRV
jgi:serine/tyrosine/threonine adenylyltransferase